MHNHANSESEGDGAQHKACCTSDRHDPIGYAIVLPLPAHRTGDFLGSTTIHRVARLPMPAHRTSELVQGRPHPPSVQALRVEAMAARQEPHLLPKLRDSKQTAHLQRAHWKAMTACTRLQTPAATSVPATATSKGSSPMEVGSQSSVMTTAPRMASATYRISRPHHVLQRGLSTAMLQGTGQHRALRH
eukprot:CAMPEP_0203842988 /NCGR_PEP_ID=MMETSP0359-20131031/2329_1 /ASSEMBLY_ACC=CAM_ASM_000338 /TAXON_ID=268821 /ORGANISM="Scrippsiella Hangoei, Strain SHTV-5" /LENGTH=188 /DNA_ID=CAMNT_0050757685 /DNA_START=52 /DNA_END=616 /DNA_ORIENTATION=+